MTQAATLAQLASSGALSADTSGNVGIGTATPEANSGFTTLSLNNATNSGVLSFQKAGVRQALIYNDAGALILYADVVTDSSIKFFTSGASERARFDSSGNLLINTTTMPAGYSKLAFRCNGDGSTWQNLGATGGSAPTTLAFLNSSGTRVGYIAQSGTGTAFTSTSDYRLKENVQSMVGALDKVAQLRPVTYKWKSTGGDGQGFIAHELQAVVPDCVNGEKDAVDADGNPNYQGVDTSFLVATLTAALQEAHGLIKDLEARLIVLESK